jgi:hypothetical protein
MMFCWFKLFNSIKSEHEARDFARLELESLLGSSKVSPVRNFVDEFAKEPLRRFVADSDRRFQDTVTYELPYGRIQGYRVDDVDPAVLPRLVRRLAYTREIYVLLQGADRKSILQNLVPNAAEGKNAEVFEADGWLLLRLITNQYFLEKSEYISKLSRDEAEVERNTETLLEYPVAELYRIPASSTLSVGKRLQDYFAIREEPSLYLSHYMHPYKGKFHPKMARALLNTVLPEDSGVAMDNFAGSGTLLVEATLLGLDSIGIEINPLSALMTKVKCECLSIPTNALRAAIDRYVDDVRSYSTLFARDASAASEIESVEHVTLDSNIKALPHLARTVKSAQDCLPGVAGEPIHDFLLLTLSGTISDLSRRTSADFAAAFIDRVEDLYRRIYLFGVLNKTLKIAPGKAKSYVGDTRAFPHEVAPGSVSAIVNSPPYSVALDYIKNDYPQLTLLKLAGSMDQLQTDMMGNPRVNYDKDALLAQMESEQGNPLRISKSAKEAVSLLMNGERVKEGLRCFKFFADMHLSLKEMWRSLKTGGRVAIVIGRNNFMVDGKYHAIPNDNIIEELASQVGFVTSQRVDRDLQKTSAGNIRKETVLFLQKP